LRVIADRTVTPVGDDRAVPVDVRLCAATLRELSALVETGAFRRDLYARLLGFKLRLPALRDRKADFGLLLRARLAQITGGDRVTFTPAALRSLFRYDWPLNIRELDSVLQRAVALTPDGEIDLQHLELQQSMAPPSRPNAGSAHVVSPGGDALVAPLGTGVGMTGVAAGTVAAWTGAPNGPAGAPAAPRSPTSTASVEMPALSIDDAALRDRLVELLTEHRGNVVIVARTLGRRRMQIYRWARRFGLDLESFRR
jgi:transcriptional regulator of acetoin/glycerol metabolism